MIPLRVAVPAILILTGAAAQPPGSAPPGLERRVQAALAQAPGQVSLYAKNLDSRAAFGIREDEPVRTASTIKLPILVALAAAVEAARLRWDDPIELRAEEKVSGSGVLGEFTDGLRLPVRDLARLMIVVSDNTATNLLLDRLKGLEDAPEGADYVNRVMDRMGFRLTRAMRKILGDGRNLKPVPTGLSAEGKKAENRRWGIGRSTPREMVTLLERLESGQVVTPAASREILAILKRQQYKEGIGRRLAGRYQVASKSGALDALRSDVGVVYTPGGRIAIAMTIDGLPQVDYSADNAGNRLIGEVSEILVEGLRKP